MFWKIPRIANQLSYKVLGFDCHSKRKKNTTKKKVLKKYYIFLEKKKIVLEYIIITLQIFLDLRGLGNPLHKAMKKKKKKYKNIYWFQNSYQVQISHPIREK